MIDWHRRAVSSVQASLVTGTLVCCLAAILSLAVGQSARAQMDPEIARGRQLFNNHCASCHGTTGAGDGPLAPAMRRSPPDITGLALANGGLFPDDRMRRIVDGRAVEAHGDREMPVWGDVFKASVGADRDESSRERIAAILKYVASIQRRRG